ncbi:hypothetical protein CYY_006292 [Polysphondylium violaceum]|uniref:Tetratricopeptide-like helical domain-containing protein n=1 Tax=Polysphondylium violaceum TaxID=133409 RepID=A0A8J4PQR5_9MYCE|nr:hypothetical protein CYY_006292 [Polysphondylium violaceum]
MNSLQRIIKLRPFHRKLVESTITKNVLSLNNSRKFNNNNNNNQNNNKITLFNSTSAVVLNNYKYYTTINQVENVEKQYQTLLDNAIEQFKLEQLHSSIEILDKAIELCNNKPEAVLLKADILNKYKFSLNVPDQLPVDLYNKALELVPHKAKVDIYRSIIYYLARTDMVESTQEYLDKLYQLGPNDEEIMFEVVLMNISSHGNIDQHLMDICKRLMDSNSTFGTIALAFISMVQQNFDQAKRLLEQVINLELNKPLEKQETPPIYHKRILIVEKNGFTRIEDLLDQDNSILADAYISLGYVERFSQHYQESTEAFKKALEISPGQFLLFSLIAHNMRVIGDNPQVIMYANKCIEFDPELETNEAYEACFDRGRAKYHSGDYDGAIQDLIRLRKKDYELGVGKVAFRSDIFEMLIYSLAGFIQHNPNSDINLKKFNVDEIIKQEDTHDICSTTTPKNPQTLLLHTQIYFRAFKSISQSIRGGMIKTTLSERNFMYDLEHLFYCLSYYLLDSMYLNYIENHSDIVRPTDEYAFRNLITQLPYKESKQSQERQEVHKYFYEVFNDVMKVIKK